MLLIPKKREQILPKFARLNAHCNQSFLYEQFLASDANFRLKNRNRSADTPGLVTGLAYFVADGPYQAYLSTYPTQTEVCGVLEASRCSYS